MSNSREEQEKYIKQLKDLVFNDLRAALEAVGAGNVKGSGNNTLLTYAVNEKNHKLVEYLLIGQNVNPNASDSNKDTPLHIAVRNDDEKMVDLLLKHGADANLVDKVGHPPLVQAFGREPPNESIIMKLVDETVFTKNIEGMLDKLAAPKPEIADDIKVEITQPKSKNKIDYSTFDAAANKVVDSTKAIYQSITKDHEDGRQAAIKTIDEFIKENKIVDPKEKVKQVREYQEPERVASRVAAIERTVQESGSTTKMPQDQIIESDAPKMGKK